MADQGNPKSLQKRSMDPGKPTDKSDNPTAGSEPVKDK